MECKYCFVSKRQISLALHNRLMILIAVQHRTLVRQHKRTGSNHVSIYYILVHMKLGTAAMFVLSALASTHLVA